MNSDLLLVVVLAGISAVVGVIAAIFYLVAGFREGVGWGIANLLPLGSLVFTVCRWEAAKGPFLLSVVAGLLAFGTYSVASDKLADGLSLDSAMLQQFTESADQKDPQEPLMALREQEVTLEEQIRATTAGLKASYQALKAKREALPPGDEAAVSAFNREAAAYEEGNRRLAAAREQLRVLRRDILKAVDERGSSAVQHAGAGNPSIKVYSTSWCGPCKMAKAHLRKRGVAFQDIDVEKSATGAEEFRKMGGGGVPLIVINGKQIRGFDAKQIDALLGKG